MKMTRRAFAVLLVVAVTSGTAWATATASASGSSSGTGLHLEAWGLRAGLTDGNDQVVGGAHFNLGEIADQWRFQPDVEVGSGDEVRSLVGTAPLFYQFHTASRMTPYAGGGITLGYFDVDADPLVPSDDDSDFGVGARATGGLEWPRRDDQAFFVELSLGFGDIHDLQMVAAWTF